ncbi:putative phage tail protein [Cronobacter sakazakii]|uniref:putative phage tail protein n=1 Tax=Cronobacter sakazakii TaxID=28141 RepID=UPI000B00C269
MAVEDEYTRLLKRLLPPGPAWEGNNPLLEGLAPSLARVHAQSSALMREIDPGAAVQLLDRYEALCGLPDECTIEETQTLSQRQRRLAAKVNGYGGINEAFYRRQLDALGYCPKTIKLYTKH